MNLIFEPPIKTFNRNLKFLKYNIFVLLLKFLTMYFRNNSKFETIHFLKLETLFILIWYTYYMYGINILNMCYEIFEKHSKIHIIVFAFNIKVIQWVHYDSFNINSCHNSSLKQSIKWKASGHGVLLSFLSHCNKWIMWNGNAPDCECINICTWIKIGKRRLCWIFHTNWQMNSTFLTLNSSCPLHFWYDLFYHWFLLDWSSPFSSQWAVFFFFCF